MGRALSGWSEVAAGSVAGVANQIVCHPFDTVRTRVQADPSLRKQSLNMKTLMRVETSVAGFYKGILPPLLAQGVYKSVLFSVNAFTHRRLADRGVSKSTATVAACGATSGAVNSFVVTPVELLRNQLMMQGVGGPRRYYSAVDVLRHCWAVSGRRPTFVVMRFYAALPVTLARDSLGMANYFSGFFHMTQVQYARHTSPSAGVTRQDVRRRFNKLGVDNSFARGS